jgi:hypothetical protein
MSECLLFVLDAPRVKTREGASAFVERWQNGSAGAPNAKIMSFLLEMQNNWPSDGDSSLWYEGAPQEPVTGPLLQLDLDLERIDKSAVEQLRTLAGRQRLHIFDPEGYVLYLADGSEVSSEALRKRMEPPLMPTQVLLSPEGLRFDGVYAAIPQAGQGSTFLRLTPDGKAYWGGSGAATPRHAFLALSDGNDAVACGKYTIKKGQFEAKVRAAWGAFRINANFVDGGLTVTSVRSDGRYPHSTTYHFQAVR